MPQITVSGQKTTEELTNAMCTVIASNPEGTTITAEVAEGCALNETVMQQLKEKNDKLVVISNTSAGKVTWTFDAVENVVAFNPMAAVGAKLDEMTAKLKNSAAAYVPIGFRQEGILPGKAVVCLDLSAYSNVLKEGKSLYLYYYDPSSGLFEKVSTGALTSGKVTFVMSHCSDYAVTNAELEKSLLSETTSPKTGDADFVVNICSVLAFFTAAAIAILLSENERKRA